MLSVARRDVYWADCFQSIGLSRLRLSPNSFVSEETISMDFADSFRILHLREVEIQILREIEMELLLAGQLIHTMGADLVYSK